MQHPKYKYDKNRKLLALVIFENSFSSGAGCSYDCARLQKMMVQKKFQIETANTQCFVFKILRMLLLSSDAKIEEKREAAAK